ncbi:hypothetical protein N657DRAFT_220882 [Parathielavia appendiculata]|uniref:Uncharacterized protein n=1 Tax=Parathielavia appendiculata TaxID=2587402 RepID=A0AAN6Z6M1_9PEZI|nr:hypothetical protein N657DRAFT_220882 [Parathielavia appendiculata]
MYSMILCSPSPGTSWPESTISGCCQSLSSDTFLLIKYLSCRDSFAMNSVPIGILLTTEGELEGVRQHTRRDAVAVKRLLLGQLLAFLDGLLAGLLGIQGSAKAAGALLVHLGTRRDTVDGHEKQLLGLDLAKEMFDVVEDGDEHLLLGETEVNIVRVLVRTVVNDAVHIQLRGSVSRLWKREAGGASAMLGGART